MSNPPTDPAPISQPPDPGQPAPATPAYPSAPTYPTAPAYPGGPVPAAPGPYGQPMVVANSSENWKGIAALVCGAVTIACIIINQAMSSASGFLGFVCLVTAILGIVFGAMGIKAAGRGKATNKAMSVAGLVIGIILCALVLIVIVFIGILLAAVL